MTGGGSAVAYLFRPKIRAAPLSRRGFQHGEQP